MASNAALMTGQLDWTGDRPAGYQPGSWQQCCCCWNRTGTRQRCCCASPARVGATAAVGATAGRLAPATIKLGPLLLCTSLITLLSPALRPAVWPAGGRLWRAGLPALDSDPGRPEEGGRGPAAAGAAAVVEAELAAGGNTPVASTAAAGAAASAVAGPCHFR